MAYRYGSSRTWEMVPGLLVWATLFFGLLLSYLAPVAVVLFIILFDLYWMFRVIYFVIYLCFAANQFRVVSKVNWMDKLKEIETTSTIYHLIFLPTYKEALPILRETLRHLKDNPFPSNRMIIVLAGEERDHDQFTKNAEVLKREFGTLFAGFYVTEHPKNLPDEIPGKGSNLNYSASQIAPILSADFPHIKDEHIVVSSFDIDTIAHEQYFAYLTYLYCTVPNPTRASYQPVALFSNNIWTSPLPVRVAAFGTTFWLLGELIRPERLWTFSSHSMPWVMLKDVGFWEKQIVSEDSRIFLQAFFHYHGDYRVVPLFLPVSMDTVTGDTYMEALKALYEQQRRWAWGVEHLPVMIQGFRKDKLIPFMKKAKYIFNHMEGMYTWATAPILIFLLGYLPLYIARSETNAFIQNAPFTLEWIMRASMIGVFASGILSLFLLPPRPQTVRWYRWLGMVIQWALLPITFFFFGALPAIDAQTRLMRGKYLGFSVSKKRKT